MISEAVGATPSQDEYRRCVESGICPECGGGPFIVLAMHTRSAHGIDRFELRERAGLKFSETITPPDFHARKSEIGRRLRAEGRVRVLDPEVQRRANRKPHRLSEAGLRTLRTNMAHASQVRRQQLAASYQSPACSWCGMKFDPPRGAMRQTCSEECRHKISSAKARAREARKRDQKPEVGTTSRSAIEEARR